MKAAAYQTKFGQPGPYFHSSNGESLATYLRAPYAPPAGWNDGFVASPTDEIGDAVSLPDRSFRTPGQRRSRDLKPHSSATTVETTLDETDFLTPDDFDDDHEVLTTPFNEQRRLQSKGRHITRTGVATVASTPSTSTATPRINLFDSTTAWNQLNSELLTPLCRQLLLLQLIDPGRYMKLGWIPSAGKTTHHSRSG